MVFAIGLFRVPPQGLDCATYGSQSCARFYIPPKSPFGKGGLVRVRVHRIEHNKKAETHIDFRSCTPSGTRTLDLSIKSALLYQLS